MVKKMGNKKFLNILKIVIVVVISFIAIQHETAVGFRFIRIIILVVIYIKIGIIRSYFLKNKTIKIITFFIDIAIIFLLELQTKYVINYAFHVFYIVILFEASLVLDKKMTIIVGITAVSVSLIKYINLLLIVSNYTKITEVLFFTFINIFTIIIITIFKSYKEEKEKTDELYNKLVQTSEKVEELAVIKERNRIASELHDSIGHKLTGLIMQLEMAEYYLNNNIEESKKLIVQSKQNSRESLKQLREVVDALKEPILQDSFISEVKKLSKSYMKMTNIKVNISSNGKEIKLSNNIKIELYRIIQEAMTNSAKHGNANIINITINYNKNDLEIIIKDDGSGCNKIVKGNGLKGITDRVEVIGGKVSFSGDDSFEIKVQIRTEE